MVGGVKPATPEPVQINPRSFFHGAKKVIRRGPLEFPAPGVFLESKVKFFAPQHSFAQDHQRGGGFAIGVVAKLQQRLRVGHDRDLVVAQHVGGDHFGIAATPFHVFVPLHAGLKFQKRVETLIHPGPLPLIGVDDHRKPVVPDFVDHHTDQAVLGALGIGQFAGLFIFDGSRPVEGDHRVFHAPDRSVDGL